MVGFGKVVSVVMLIVCAITLIGAIAFTTSSAGAGAEGGMIFLGAIVSAFVLAGMATIVWNVATIAERVRKPAAEARVHDAEAIFSKL